MTFPKPQNPPKRHEIYFFNKTICQLVKGSQDFLYYMAHKTYSLYVNSTIFVPFSSTETVLKNLQQKLVPSAAAPQLGP